MSRSWAELSQALKMNHQADLKLNDPPLSGRPCDIHEDTLLAIVVIKSTEEIDINNPVLRWDIVVKNNEGYVLDK